MFNNPLKKYKSGGVTPEQARQQVVQFIIQKTGATEDQVNGFLDKISGDEKALGEFQQILELASKDDPKGIDMLKQLFGTQSSQFAKKGGKLHDFICKHKKGGVAGCGCSPIKGDNGIPGGIPATDYGYRAINRPNRPALEQLMDEDGSVAATRMINGADTTLTIPSKHGDMPLILSNNLRGANAPGKWMMRRMGEPGVMVAPKGTSKY